MKTLTVGFIILLGLFFNNTETYAQSCTSLYTFTPLTDTCDGGDPLPDGTIACIYWDQDNDGPDGSDPLPEVGECPACVNFNCFTLNGTDVMGEPGTFFFLEAFCFVQTIPTPSAFYVRVPIGANLCWTSEVFVIVPGFTEIELDQWTCGPCPGEEPGPITGLTATQDLCREVLVTWNPANFAMGYQVMIDGVIAGTVFIPQFVHGIFTPEQPPYCHSYRVKAVNEYGEGPLSDPVQGCYITFLNPPTNVNASNDLCFEVRVTWNAVPGALGYEVRRDGFPLITVTGVTEYTDETQPGFVYWYSVSSVNECGTGVASPNDNGVALVPPQPVLNAAASTTEDDRITVSWSAATGATGYEILRAEQRDPQFLVIGAAPQFVLSYDDFSARPGVEYLYRVRGVNLCGAGSESPTAPGLRQLSGPVRFEELVVTTDLAGAMSVEAADLDDDGDQDIVAAGMFADKVAWYENTRDGFVEHVLVAGWQGARAVDVGDIDSDGDLDIAAVAYFENALMWWEKTTLGYFMQPISGAVNGATDINIVNVTFGGEVEILTAAATDGEISMWWYLDDEGFGNSIFADNLPGVRSLSSGWHRNPNSLRIFAAAQDSGELVSWASINGYARQSLGFYPGLSACGGAQLNIEADSVVDAFFCVNDDNYLGWRDGATGVAHDVSSLIESPRDVVAARIDGDPRNDLVLASGHEISWWRSTEHRFYRNVVTDNLPQASAVQALDFENDGDMDILAAGDHEIRLYLSQLANDEHNATLLKPAVEDDGSVRGASSLPREFALLQNHPNPFNAVTQIQFDLPDASEVRLTIFDVTGREVASLVNESLAPGQHSVSFNASALSSGVYFYRLAAGSFVETKKMVLLK